MGREDVYRIVAPRHTALPVETRCFASHRDGAIYPSSARARRALPTAPTGQHTPAQGNALGVTGIMGMTTIPYIENEYLGRCPRLGYAALSGLQSPRRAKTHGRASLRAMPYNIPRRGETRSIASLQALPSINTAFIATNPNRPSITTAFVVANPNRPSIDTRRTATNTNRASIDARRIATNTNRPSIATRRNATNTNRPSIDARRTATSTNRPSIEARRFATSTNRPSIATRRNASTPFCPPSGHPSTQILHTNKKI
jgi:hypothetical protein